MADNDQSVPTRAKVQEPGGEISTLTVRQLMWQRFKRNRLAIGGGIVLAIMYFLILALMNMAKKFTRRHWSRKKT